MKFITVLRAFLPLYALFFVGCEDAKNQEIRDAIYLVEAEEGMQSLMINDVNGAIGGGTVKSASPVMEDVKVAVKVDQASVEDYNEKHGTNYQLLPEDYYTVLTPEVTIKAGSVFSDKISVQIKPFSQEMKDSGKKFVLPITIDSSSNSNLQILNSKKSAFYACTFAIVSKAIVLTNQNKVIPTMRQDYVLPEWTLEMRIKASIVGKNYNNQAFCNIVSGPGGPLGSIFGRFEGEIIQVLVNGKACNFNVTPKANTWYHLAIVYRASTATVELYLNGVLNNTIQAQQFEKITQFKHDCFTLSNVSSYRRATYTMHEVRWWTKAISGSQIKNNMFSIDPQSDGLEGYWKMNAIDGKILHDATGHGNDAEVVGNGPITWETVRSDE